MYQFISIGGWCGTRMALDQQNITNEAYNIFDHVRSSSKGIVDCVKNDFVNFLPKKKEVDKRFINFSPFMSEHFGFYHSGDLTNESSLNSIDRKIQRFYKHCRSNKHVIFMRTCVLPDYKEEINDMEQLSLELKNKYPKLKFIIVFIIPDQDVSAYYTNIGNNIFMFTLNDKSNDQNNLGNEYSSIFEFILKNNLFKNEPTSNKQINIVTPTSKLCLVDYLPAVNYFEKYN